MQQCATLEPSFPKKKTRARKKQTRPHSHSSTFSFGARVNKYVNFVAIDKEKSPPRFCDWRLTVARYAYVGVAKKTSFSIALRNLHVSSAFHFLLFSTWLLPRIKSRVKIGTRENGEWLKKRPRNCRIENYNCACIYRMRFFRAADICNGSWLLLSNVRHFLKTGENICKN